MTNWMTRWLPGQRRRNYCHTNGRSLSQRLTPEVGELVAPPVDARDAVMGCGWFDSSWDLQHGLAVLEGPVIDPLGLWRFERRLARQAQSAAL